MLKKYKTEILENISETSSGGTPSRDNADFYKGDIPWITTGELKDGYIFDSKEHITKEALKNSAAKIFPTGTVLMAMYGATIGRLGILKVDAATNQACCAFFPNEQKLKAKYLFYWLFYHRSQLIDMGTGAGQPNISQNIIKKLEIDLPTIQEQDEIVNALSDIDNLISTQEALIVKKQAIKQGAMQELLTGKRRLAGFVNNWKKEVLGNIAQTSSGGTPSRAITEYYKGNIPWVTTSELRDAYIYETKEYISQKALESSSAKLFPVDTLIMAMYGATIGRLGIIKIEAATNQACCAFFVDEKELDSKYLYYWLLFHRNDLVELGTGAGQSNISQSIISDIEIDLPDIKEQLAIVELLSEMDTDIANQQAKLEKLRRIKSGMMDKLLTGKIRLTD